MANHTSIEEVREMFTDMGHDDLVRVSVDNVATLRTVRGANAELSKQLLAERAKVRELEAEVTRLKTFSEAAAAAVLQLTGEQKPKGATYSDMLRAKQTEEVREVERAIAEQRELERERREEQRLGRQQRRLAEQELAAREAGRDAVVAATATPPDAPLPPAPETGMTPGAALGWRSSAH